MNLRFAILDCGLGSGRRRRDNPTEHAGGEGGPLTRFSRSVRFAWRDAAMHRLLVTSLLSNL